MAMPERKAERLFQIAADAQANGIPVDLTDFGFNPNTGEFTDNISPAAIRKLVEDGRESRVLTSKDIDYLERINKELTQNLSKS